MTRLETARRRYAEAVRGLDGTLMAAERMREARDEMWCAEWVEQAARKEIEKAARGFDQRRTYKDESPTTGVSNESHH